MLVIMWVELVVVSVGLNVVSGSGSSAHVLAFVAHRRCGGTGLVELAQRLAHFVDHDGFRDEPAIGHHTTNRQHSPLYAIDGLDCLRRISHPTHRDIRR